MLTISTKHEGVVFVGDLGVRNVYTPVDKGRLLSKRLYELTITSNV